MQQQGGRWILPPAAPDWYVEPGVPARMTQRTSLFERIDSPFRKHRVHVPCCPGSVPVPIVGGAGFSAVMKTLTPASTLLLTLGGMTPPPGSGDACVALWAQTRLCRHPTRRPGREGNAGVTATGLRSGDILSRMRGRGIFRLGPYVHSCRAGAPHHDPYHCVFQSKGWHRQNHQHAQCCCGAG